MIDPNVCLIYTSIATTECGPEQLAEIAKIAAENNSKIGVTGVLLHSSDVFMQLLEGPAEAIQDLYHNRIQADKRHTDMKVIYKHPITERIFPNWSMGKLFLNKKGNNEELKQAFDDMLDEMNAVESVGITPVRILEAYTRVYGDDLDLLNIRNWLSKGQTSAA